MKILVLTSQSTCDAEVAQTVTLLARSLRERGHAVRVLGCQKSSTGEHVEREHSIAWLGGPVQFLRRFLDGGLLFCKAVSMVHRDRPDVIHALDEAAVLAYWLRKFYRIPYVYDMDAPLQDRVVETYPIFRPARRLMRAWLKPIITHALLVAPMCEAVAETVKRTDSARIVILRDVSSMEEGTPPDPNAHEC